MASNISSEMSENKEKAIVNAEVRSLQDHNSAEIGFENDQDIFLNPDRSLHLKFISIPQFYHPYTQVIMAGTVNLCAVGGFNSIISLGQSGLSDNVSDSANYTLYALFAVSSIFAPSLVSFFGVKPMITLGALGYAIYGSAFWCYRTTQNIPYVYFGGAACGLSASILWVSCGVVMSSYGTESQKGKFTAVFFFLSFLGAVIGGIIPLAQNLDNSSRGSVTNGTYMGFTFMMLAGCLFGLFVANPDKMIRTDGTKVLKEKPQGLKYEMKAFYLEVKKDPLLWAAFAPFSFMALFYSTFQANDFNYAFFNLRTRSLNGLLYGISQLIGAMMLGLFLDIKYIRLRKRVIIGWTVLSTIVFILCLLAYFPTKELHRGVDYTPALDFKDGGKAAAYMALYFFFGFQDGCFQTFAFYLMGVLSNDPTVIAMYTGFYKIFGAAAAAISFGADADSVSYMGMFGSYWGICLVGMISCAVLVFKRVHDPAKGF